MMRILFAIALFIGCLLPASSQDCLPQEPLPSPVHQTILEGFIVQATQSKFLTEDKGAVSITRSVDSLGREEWTVATFSDNFYRNYWHLPVGYYTVLGRIVLISNKVDNPNNPNSPGALTEPERSQIVQCLNSLVRKWLIPPPPVEEVWAWWPVYENGKPKLDERGRVVQERRRVQKMDLSTGSSEMRYRYVFDLNGSVRRYPAAGY